MEKKWNIIPWISLSFLLVGMLLSFCSAFDCKITLKQHAIQSILIAGVVCAIILQFRKKYAGVLILVGLFVMAGLALLWFERLKEDFLVLTYYIDEKAIDYNKVALFNLGGTPGALDDNYLLRLIGILLAVFICFFAFRIQSRSYGLIPVWGVPALGLSLGRAPDKRAVLFLLVGVGLAYAWIASQERGGRKSFAVRRITGRGRGFFAYLVLCLLLVLGVCGGFWYGQKKEKKILSYSEAYLKRQHQMERELASTVNRAVQFVKGEFGVESDGRLSNEEPQYSNKVVMEVTVSVKPKESFYLRGFTGGSYQNGKWDACDAEAFEEMAVSKEFERDIWNIGYKYFRNLLDGDPLISEVVSGWKEYEQSEVQLRLEYKDKGKWGTYAYIPYFADVESIVDGSGNTGADLNGENALRKKSNTYYVNCYNMGTSCYDTVREQGRVLEPEVSADGMVLVKDDMLDIASMGRGENYCLYVEERYAGLPENKLPRLKEALQRISVNRSDAIDAAWEIQGFLTKQAVYSKELEPVPAGEDYAEYFLLTQKKGYCEHFATAGTLLLRAAGIPARYVSGYRVEPEMFQENEDGSYTAEILDSDAHAWSEVFDENGIGWIPMEMTPGSVGERDNGVRQTAQSGDSQMSMAPKVTLKPTPKPTKKPKATLKPTPKATVEPKEESPDKNHMEGTPERLYWDITLIVCLAIILLLAVGRIGYLRFCIRRYRRKLQQCGGDRRGFVRLRTEQLLYCLKHSGLPEVEGMGMREWCQRLAEFIGEEYGGSEWEDFCEVIQKAVFAKEPVTEEEFCLFSDRVLYVEQAVFARQGRWKKLYLRCIGLKI